MSKPFQSRVLLMKIFKNRLPYSLANQRNAIASITSKINSQNRSATVGPRSSFYLTVRLFCDINLCDSQKGSAVVKLNDGQKISFKDLDPKDSKSMKEIMNEIKVMGQLTNPNDKNIQESIRSSKRLRHDFLQKAKLEKYRNAMIDNLNSLLYFYDCCNRSDEFSNTLALMKSNNVINEATFSVVVRHKVRTENWTIGLKVIKQMRKNGIEPHSRTYHSIILNCIEMGDFKDALNLFKEMKKLEIVFSDEFYSSLLSLIISKKNSRKGFMLEILNLLKDTGFTLGAKSFEDARNWFSSGGDDGTWNAKVWTIDPSGICKNCGLQLKEFTLPDAVGLNLQQKLLEVAENAISKAEKNLNVNPLEELLDISVNKNPSGKINLLKQLISISGPFDVVLDVLNIAYAGNKGFNSFQVKRVAKHHLDNGKKILALCSSPLLSSLLQKRVPDSSQQHMVDLLHFLRRWKCGIFFVDDHKKDGHIDDYFLLLSIVFHNMNIDIVTADNFFDHVHSFDPVTKRHFGRWKRSRQIVIKRFTAKGMPVFATRENFDIDVQSNQNSWHIPGPNGKWLCCTRR